MAVETWEIGWGDGIPMDEVAFDAIIVLDTGNFDNGLGYERIVIARGWNPWAADQMAKIQYRIDRMPDNSFCTGAVWHSSTVDWLDQGSLPVEDYWRWMPGFERSSTDRAAQQGKQLIKDMLIKVHRIAVEADRMVRERET